MSILEEIKYFTDKIFKISSVPKRFVNNINKLQHVGFAGIDSRTDPEKLRSIEKEYPMVEWGVLMSSHWNENGNRYMNPEDLHKFEGLNLCGHLCGQMAKDMMKNDTHLLDKTYPGWEKIFKRIQVNVAPYDFEEGLDWKGNQELFIQCKPGKYVTYEKSTGVGMIIDGSGGRGKSEKWTIYPSDKKIGYAGGLNPDNVVQKTQDLMDNPKVSDFWIDMESGVRTDDWFDIEKVRKVLENLTKSYIL